MTRIKNIALALCWPVLILAALAIMLVIVATDSVEGR